MIRLSQLIEQLRDGRVPRPLRGSEQGYEAHPRWIGVQGEGVRSSVREILRDGVEWQDTQR